MSEFTTLAAELPRQMARVRDEVMPAYQHPMLNGSGAFAIAMMRDALDRAAVAMAHGDTVEMLRICEELSEFET